MLIYELKKALKSPGFKLALIISIIIVMMDYVVNVMPLLISNHELLMERSNIYDVLPFNSYEKWIGGRETSISVAFFILVPLIASMPYGDSYFKDMNNGLGNYILVKCDSRKYVNAKYIATFLSGAIAVGIPMICSYLICSMTMSTYAPFPDDGMNMMMPKSSMSYIYYKYPLLYLIISILMVMVYAGCMATVAMCVTIYTNRIYMVEIFPMLLSVAIISFGEIIENNAIMPINFINPSYSYPRLVYYFITVGIIMLFTYINVRVFRNGKYDK